ncbi:hypothetical protein BS47DRAFT_1368702 [Hydnum rufescens UP504]|uniref:Uncharacterized protein n=1 Tax=Hydnum rufescens UP504 TaxID=1448309 RepID=A0A9P6AFT7_9AGAM|nr:hypothetical protein BS47DRAFT_1368702 [Hydnum rufescens UP504]
MRLWLSDGCQGKRLPRLHCGDHREGHARNDPRRWLGQNCQGKQLPGPHHGEMRLWLGDGCRGKRLPHGCIVEIIGRGMRRMIQGDGLGRTVKGNGFQGRIMERRSFGSATAAEGNGFRGCIVEIIGRGMQQNDPKGWLEKRLSRLWLGEGDVAQDPAN